jgi:NADH:ubiquinone oxidoreductase subunit F (NADH-binding)
VAASHYLNNKLCGSCKPCKNEGCNHWWKIYQTKR